MEADKARADARKPNIRLRGTHRYESIDDSTDLEVQLLSVVWGFKVVLAIDVKIDGEVRQLVVDILSEAYEQSDAGRTYVCRLLSGEVVPGLEREVSILIPANGGKALVSVPY